MPGIVPDFEVEFRHGQRTLSVAYRQLPLFVWENLKQQLGYNPVTLLDALTEQEIDATAAVIWLERLQRERKLGYREVMRELNEDDREFELVDVRHEGESFLDITYGTANGQAEAVEDDGEGDDETGPPSGSS